MLKKFSAKSALNGAVFGGVVAGIATYLGESMLWWLAMPAAAIASAFDTAKAGDQGGSPTWSSSTSSDSPTYGDSSGGGDSGGGGGGDGG